MKPQTQKYNAKPINFCKILDDSEENIPQNAAKSVVRKSSVSEKVIVSSSDGKFFLNKSCR